jgi:glycerol uptake facilitator-like aquaporin
MLPERFRPYLAEFVATALFVFGGTQAVVSSSTMGFDTLAVSFSFGLGIYVWVQAIDDVSGGHMNPAVTFALIISKNIGIVKGLIYIVAQLAGATLGAAFTHAISPVSAINAVNDVNSNFTRGQAFFGETLMTFVLVYVVFSTAVRKRDNISMVCNF